MKTESLITSEVDFEQDGKHHGYLRLPHSVHRSAYGWIPFPAISVKNGSGPVVLLMGGNHGDEFEGQIALCELAHMVNPGDVNGQLIILPMANYPAAKAGLRTSPIDNGNLNRSFPGNPVGTPTEMIAHYIESELLTRSDYLLDIHSGGSSLLYHPTVMMARSDDDAQQKRNLELLSSFGFPFAVLYKRARSGSYSSSAAYRQKVMPITAEIGGAGTVDPGALRQLRAGIGRYLEHLGVIDSPVDIPETSAVATQFFEIPSDKYYVYSPHDGLFEPAVEIGAEVSRGQLAGRLHDPSAPLEPPHPIHFNQDATVICKRVPAITERGDCLFELAIPAR